MFESPDISSTGEPITKSQQEKFAEDGTPETSSSPGKRIGARQFISTFGTSIFIDGCMLIQGMILARLLGPVSRGDYAAIILWPTILSYAGLFGTSFAIGRLAAKEKDVGPVLRTGFLLAIATSLLVAFLGYWLLPLLIPVEKHRILPLARLALLYIPMYQIAANLVAVDQGTANFFRLNFIRALQSPVLIACLIIIYLLGLGEVIWFVLALLATNIAVALSRTILLFRDYSIKGRLYSPIKILRGGFSFGLVEIGAQIYQHIDKILLLWLLEPRYMGMYVVALSASSAINTISSSMGLVSFTITAQAAETEGFSRVGSIFRKAAITKLVCGAALAMAMPILLPLVYSKEFGEAVKPAIILIAGSALAGLSLLLDQCMRGQGKPFAGLAGRIAAIITMVVIGLPASRVLGWGIIGISIAFAVSRLVCLYAIIMQVLIHYKNARLSDFVPKKRDFVELMAAVKATLGKLRWTNYRKFILEGSDNNV